MYPRSIGNDVTGVRERSQQSGNLKDEGDISPKASKKYVFIFKNDNGFLASSLVKWGCAL
ncbi:hypothetical protein [Xenorhabdus mauleonii]|uniref:hypothetical protein n=1 Tax=Xenorhabdus mauleonii TaxID=351675 RepID=UPI0015871A25|nr:hypothetical protein [Xenorhabdus mauleonii]